MVELNADDTIAILLLQIDRLQAENKRLRATIDRHSVTVRDIELRADLQARVDE